MITFIVGFAVGQVFMFLIMYMGYRWNELRGEGQMKEYAKSFYKSAAWRKCRASYFAYRHGLCERCSGPGKIVHHKQYITPENITDPDITLSFNNLELLCQDCHNREHHEVNGVSI